MGRYLIYDQNNKKHENVQVSGQKVAMEIRRSNGIDVVNATLVPNDVTYAASIRTSYSNRPADGVDNIRISGCKLAKTGEPTPTYTKSESNPIVNNDNMSLEMGTKRFYAKGSEFGGARDACVDGKSGEHEGQQHYLHYYSAGNKYMPAYRQLRIRDNGEFILANDVINVQNGTNIVWFKQYGQQAGMLKIYNCQFVFENGTVANKIPLQFVDVEDADKVSIFQNSIEYLNEDPFKSIDFFQDEEEQPEPEPPVIGQNEEFEYIEVKDNASSDKVEKKRSEGWILVGDPVQYLKQSVEYEALMKRPKQ